MRNALRRDGQIWTDRVLQSGYVRFEPLDGGGRRTPIVSMLNLKGGVGKTTATANLGAALAHLGYRVLLVDLDLQGSLTGMFLPPKDQRRAFDDRRLVGDFLEAAFDAEHPNILDYTRPVGLPGGASLVPTTDVLAYAEMNLTVRWFLRDSNRDPRFLLRRELHYKRVTDRYDVVLLDCPPLVNVSCANALAASDYVLVPVLPSTQATDRVVDMLAVLKQFRENINADLNVMGVFANRTSGRELSGNELNRLSALANQCKDAWGVPVPMFDTFIRQSVEVRQAEDERRPLGADDPMFESFVALAREVASRLPMFCRPTADLPAAAGVGA